MKEEEIVSKVFPGDAMTQPHRVILHRLEPDEWVTHMENMTKDKFGDYISKVPVPDLYWGHYFKDYDEALKDYGNRRLKLETDSNSLTATQRRYS